MTTMLSAPLDGPDSGVAPQSGPVRLLIEGWRFRPHSYALVNQMQCLELLKRPDVKLFHSEYEYLPMLGGECSGLLKDTQEAAIRAIPRPDGKPFDAVYRIGYPYNFGPGPAPTFVFATCERMIVEPHSWIGGDGSVGSVVERNNITIITPSEWSRLGFVASGVNPDRVVVVPHGVDTDTFCPIPDDTRAARRKDMGFEDRFVFLNVSALTGNKNVGAVIRAFARIVVKHPKAHLVIKGLDAVYRSGDWLSEEMREMDAYARWKTTKNMTYIGAATSSEYIASLYQAADCYVSPYQSEGFNLPVLEASACGLPVIVPKGGCTDDFVTDDFAVRIPSRISDHDADDHLWIKTKVDDIEAAMLRVMEDSEFRSRSLRAGAENAQKYTWKSVTDRLMGVVSAHLKGNA